MSGARVVFWRREGTVGYGIPQVLRAVMIVSALSATAPAQPAADPTFDVVSLKPAKCNDHRGSDGGPGSQDPIRYTFRAATVEDLIGISYDVDSFRISSKVALDQQCFDLDARVATGASRDDFRFMMRNLLMARFHLKAHLEPREYPAYELVVASSGSKLKESGADGVPNATESLDGFPELPGTAPGFTSRQSRSGPGQQLIRIRARQQSMSALAKRLIAPDAQFVVDRTGLNAKYDFTLEYAIESGAGSDTASPPVADLFHSLRQQLGLELVKSRVTRDLVVVESVDKVPTEN